MKNDKYIKLSAVTSTIQNQINAIQLNEYTYNIGVSQLYQALNNILKLPTIETLSPNQLTSQWISLYSNVNDYYDWFCDNCTYHYGECNRTDLPLFCQNCGAKMEI